MEGCGFMDILEGIAGIGLAIIDYLVDYDNNWNECLLIGQLQELKHQN